MKNRTENRMREIQRNDRKTDILPFSGRGVEEIKRVVEHLTTGITRAITECVPIIRSRKLPHPVVNAEVRNLVEEAKRLKILVPKEWTSSRRREIY